MALKHSEYCRKEKEIAEIHTNLIIIKKIVMGNGKDGLVVTVPALNTNVENLNMTMKGFERSVNGFVKYQQTMEGMNQGKQQMSRRNRWIIGLLVGLNTALVAGLITLIVKLV